MFGIDDKQNKTIKDWIKTHNCKLRTSEHGIKDEIYVGAIGGAITYCFTPTGIGNATFVKCSCGAELDVTDYDEW